MGVILLLVIVLLVWLVNWRVALLAPRWLSTSVIPQMFLKRLNLLFEYDLILADRQVQFPVHVIQRYLHLVVAWVDTAWIIVAIFIGDELGPDVDKVSRHLSNVIHIKISFLKVIVGRLVDLWWYLAWLSRTQDVILPADWDQHLLLGGLSQQEWLLLLLLLLWLLIWVRNVLIRMLLLGLN